jgi:hypothetical protein
MTGFVVTAINPDWNFMEGHALAVNFKRYYYNFLSLKIYPIIYSECLFCYLYVCKRNERSNIIND